MPKMRLKSGTHVHNGELVNVGEVIDLTPQQARAFHDRFEPADAPKAPAPVVDTKLAVPVPEPAGPGGTPHDPYGVPPASGPSKTKDRPGPGDPVPLS